MEHPILCFGEVLWDTFEEGKKPGGAPMNVALHLLQQGKPTIMASRVGDDDDGRQLLDFLRSVRLSAELIQTDPEFPTCVVGVELDANQHATYTIPKPVSWDNIQLEPDLAKAAVAAPVIVYGSLASRSATTAATLNKLLGDSTQAIKVFDVNLRAPHYELDTIKTLAGHSNIIKMNAEELELLAGTELMHFTQKEKITFIAEYFGCTTVCVTRAESGAIVLHDNQFYDHRGYRVNVVDTVGAGDSFLATFISGLLNGDDLKIILQNACAVGAFVAANRGANPVYNTKVIKQIHLQNSSAG